jgi:hypothetical protein
MRDSVVNLQAANAKNSTEKNLLPSTELQLDQFWNWYQDYRNVESNVERSRYQVECVLVDAIVRLPGSIPRRPDRRDRLTRKCHRQGKSNGI